MPNIWNILPPFSSTFQAMMLSGIALLTIRRGPPWIGLSGLIVFSVVGCNRTFYRRTADCDAYSVVAEKGAGPNWVVPRGFNIDPDPRSRFFDPTRPTDPLLPVPAPRLYGYQLPDLVTPPAEPRDLETEARTEFQVEELPAPPEVEPGDAELQSFRSGRRTPASTPVNDVAQVSNRSMNRVVSIKPPPNQTLPSKNITPQAEELNGPSDAVVFASASAAPVVHSAVSIQI